MYARNVDANQGDIVEAFTARGATVYVLGKPVDLLVGYRAVNVLVEVKNPNRLNRSRSATFTKAQREFIHEWQGMVRAVETVDEANLLLDRIDFDVEHGESHDRET